MIAMNTEGSLAKTTIHSTRESIRESRSRANRRGCHLRPFLRKTQ
jgi:hypothetical protein